MNGSNFLLRVMQFFEWKPHVMHHHPVKFSTDRTRAIANITFFICHDTTYDHVIKVSCDFVPGGQVP